MAGIKITTFLGTAPKVSPELLPNTAAQIAQNCKLYSGDLIPYPQPIVRGSTSRTGTIKTLRGLRDPVTSAIRWLSWTTDVDIVTAIETDTAEQRFFYTGDGVPKVSTYALATASLPYPAGYYELGLPIPPDSATLTTSATAFTQKTSASYARDTNNVATIVTGTAHGLRTGNSISVSQFSFVAGTYNQPGTQTITVTINNHGLSNGAVVSLDFITGSATDGTYVISSVATNTFEITASAATTSGDVRLDIRSFNATNVECTVVDSTTFTYFSPGPAVATTANTSGKIDLGGLTQARSYVFTWYTPWDEESIASKPSDNLYIKEGTTVTVSNLPNAQPAGNNFIRGVRLYRTLPSVSGTDYFLLKTLWFPTALSLVQRTSNVSRVTLSQPHNFGIDDRFKISGCTNATFNITGGIVTDLIDDYTFEYSQVAADVASTSVAAGTLYHDVSENPPTTTARYWGDGSYDFTDDFDSTLLLTVLESDEYDAPPNDLQGLTAIQNQILCGFVGNKLYFSEIAKPHAWPIAYAQTVEHQIVGVAPLGGSALVLTNGYPYIVQGSDPATLSVSRVDVLYPCLNRRSIVAMNYGVVYSTHDGLAVASPGGTQLITRLLYNNDTWQTSLDPSTIVAEYYGDAYFASHSNGAFIFERDERVGGYFVNATYSFTASWYDEVTGKLYYVSGTNGDVYEWDDLTQPPVFQEWKSKVIITPGMMNFGAARVIADYAAETTLWDSVSTQWENTTASWSSVDPVTFNLWVDKQLLFTTSLADTNTFRLPTGYRSDTFEVGVSGNVRIRAIHMAETALGLREV